jgi:hypothetical protein
MGRHHIVTGVVLVAVVAGTTFWLTVRSNSPSKPAPVAEVTAAEQVDPGIAAHKPHLAPPPPEPTFAGREQTVQYYGTLVEGERRALRVVEDALGKAQSAPGGGGGWEHTARLQAMRDDYRARIERHQAKLAVAP